MASCLDCGAFVTVEEMFSVELNVGYFCGPCDDRRARDFFSDGSDRLEMLQRWQEDIDEKLELARF